MLTGETPETLKNGLIIPVVVVRHRADNGLQVRLDSGIEGIIEAGYISDTLIDVRAQFPVGKTILALVNECKYDSFSVELDCRDQQISQGDLEIPDFWARSLLGR